MIEICIQNLFEFDLKMKMEKIELDKHLIWKKKEKVTFWPNSNQPGLLPPPSQPALPGAAHPAAAPR